MPFVYALFPDRRRATYNRFFTLLKQKVAEMNVNLAIDIVQMDFEQAALKSAAEHFPAVKGYFFHFTQSVFRKAHILGLKEEYSKRTNPPNLVRLTVRRCCALPLLPPDKAIGTFNLVIKPSVID